MMAMLIPKNYAPKPYHLTDKHIGEYWIDSYASYLTARFMRKLYVKDYEHARN